VGESGTDTWHLSGRMIGCHVAQSRAATWHPGFFQYGYVKILVWSGGFEPATSPTATTSQLSVNHRRPWFGTCYEYGNLIYLKLYVETAGGMGRGLAPTPGYMC
jgi:hypothetical protein